MINKNSSDNNMISPIFNEDILKERGFGLIAERFKDEYPKTFTHFIMLAKRDEFSSVLGSYLDWYKDKLNI